MKYQTTLIILLFSFVGLTIEISIGFDLVSYIYNQHNTLLNEALPILPLLVIGLIIDIRNYKIIMKEKEKLEVYKKTINSMHNLLTDLQSNFHVINVVDYFKDKKGLDVLNEINSASHDIEKILDKLSYLEGSNPDKVCIDTVLKKE